MKFKATALTVRDVEDNGSANEQGNDLNSITNGLELSGHRSAETHIADDDGRERVDHAVGDSPESNNQLRSVEDIYVTHAANTLMKIRIVLGSKKPLATWALSNDLFLIPVWFPATRLTAMRRSLWLRNLALDGVSGRRNQMTKAQRQVTPPS